MTDYSILFVCTANRCRSPMAEGLWRTHISQLGEFAQWTIGSAGTWTVDGHSAMPNTIRALSAQGTHMDAHTSRVIDTSLMEKYSLILVMERGHKEALQAEFADHRERIFLLTEMVSQRYDIQDPVAGTLEDYKHTLAEIERILIQGEQRIRTLAANQPS